MSSLLPILKANADPATIADKTAYHKTPLPVLGTPNPAINAAVAEFRGAHDMAACLAEARDLWASGIFEARIAAGKLLIKARIRPPELEAETWEQIAAWVPEFDGWAIADHLASAGERRVMADLGRLDTLEAWSESPHLWTRRAALVFSLPLAKLTHPNADQLAARKRVLTWAERYAREPEWFLQKALSWWLRTLSMHDPDMVRAFMAAHGDAMKGFARKDATRKLPPETP
ncbi:DNA alkylation repair protein [Oceanibium sediminis]|uniref:DNA alkylation repair protein n=1 Tax=Oceanibium sediminis TaxID=2026339 RepID=UPI000DD3E93E|nr:DNA alkylation repair protein [Oceanibium sediminis]